MLSFLDFLPSHEETDAQKAQQRAKGFLEGVRAVVGTDPIRRKHRKILTYAYDNFNKADQFFYDVNKAASDKRWESLRVDPEAALYIYQQALSLLTQSAASLGKDHPVTTHLREGLDGMNKFIPIEKVDSEHV